VVLPLENLSGDREQDYFRRRNDGRFNREPGENPFAAGDFEINGDGL